VSPERRIVSSDPPELQARSPARKMRQAVKRSLIAALAVSFLAIAPLAVPGCSKKDDSTEKRALPPLHFDGLTPNLMLTWLDKQGGTHVEAAPEKVPVDEQALVRVLISDSEDGSRDPIYVADLSKPDADGRFTARGVPRSAWEDEISRRRRDADPELAVAEAPRAPERQRPAAPPSDPLQGPQQQGPQPTPGGSSDAAPPLNPAFASVVVIVYGAEWCGPCHDARAHLKKKGVKTIYKDIDRDRAAQAEMKQKLDKIGGRRGSIPVIDVGGQILVGYSAAALDSALKRALGGTAL